MKFRKSLIVLLICLVPMLVALKAAMRLRAPMPGGSAVNILELEDITGTDVFIIGGDGQRTTAAGETPMNYIELPLTSFTADGAALTALTTDDVFVSERTARIGNTNGNPSIVLGDTSRKIETSFSIPPNYYQNGKFYLTVRSNEPYHAAKVEFAVRRGTTTSLDTSDSVAETAVALAASPSVATVEQIILDPASEDDSFAADNWITIKVNRLANVHGFNANLEIYSFVFGYETQY